MSGKLPFFPLQGVPISFGQLFKHFWDHFWTTLDYFKLFLTSSILFGTFQKVFLGVGQPVGNIRVMFPASKDEISVLFSSKRKSLLLRFIIKHGQMLLYRSCSQKMCRMTRHYSSPTIKLGLTRLESTFFGLSKETFLPFLLKTFNWYTIQKVQVLSKNPFSSIFGAFLRVKIT